MDSWEYRSLLIELLQEWEFDNRSNQERENNPNKYCRPNQRINFEASWLLGNVRMFECDGTLHEKRFDELELEDGFLEFGDGFDV